MVFPHEYATEAYLASIFLPSRFLFGPSERGKEKCSSNVTLVQSMRFLAFVFLFPCILRTIRIPVGSESIGGDSKSIVNFCVNTQKFTIGSCSVRKTRSTSFKSPA